MIHIGNHQAGILLSDVPRYSYAEFYTTVDTLLSQPTHRCVMYFAYPLATGGYLCICAIANDTQHNIALLAHQVPANMQSPLQALTAKHACMHVFEREMHEAYGIPFAKHPWLKPLRFPADRYNQASTIDNYPFYTLEGEEVHEVGVGPIHAGIVEPGYFRFACDGEQVLHLEPVLGFQHRGVEPLMISKPHMLQQTVLAESIAGDTAVGHTLAYVLAMESLAGITTPLPLQWERMLALEMERVATHIADTSALCADVAYQLGQVVCEALRTMVINTLQLWCGNRFGKGLIRPAGTHYPVQLDLIHQMQATLGQVRQQFATMGTTLLASPSVAARFETTAPLSAKQAQLAGVVGLAARASGLPRDVRSTQAFLDYAQQNFAPIMLQDGDVQARLAMRIREVEQSLALIMDLLGQLEQAITQQQYSPSGTPNYHLQCQPHSLALSLVECWLGEACHVAITGQHGELVHYKIKDPSLHNWWGLALAMRGQQISDFPICNKSFNLSYCGHDL